MTGLVVRAGTPKVALIYAAVGNGLAVTWNELDDGYTRTAVHPGALSQPLILAAAEAGNLSMAENLRATVPSARPHWAARRGRWMRSGCCRRFANWRSAMRRDWRLR